MRGQGRPSFGSDGRVGPKWRKGVGPTKTGQHDPNPRRDPRGLLGILCSGQDSEVSGRGSGDRYVLSEVSGLVGEGPCSLVRSSLRPTFLVGTKDPKGTGGLTRSSRERLGILGPGSLRGGDPW